VKVPEHAAWINWYSGRVDRSVLFKMQSSNIR
jgi:hypothetical protein